MAREPGAVVKDYRAAPLGGKAASTPAGAPATGSAALPGSRRAAPRREWRSCMTGRAGPPLPYSFQCQASGRLLGRPAPAQAVENRLPQERIALQAGTLPAAGAGLLLGRKRADSHGSRSHCASTLQPPPVAGGPDLPRFGGLSVPQREDGPFHSALQW